MPSASAVTISVLGIASFIVGAQTLASPASMTTQMGLPAGALPSVIGNGLAATGMGIFCLIAGFREDKVFMRANLLMKVVTGTVMWSLGGMWRLGGWWELGGAVVLGTALFWN